MRKALCNEHHGMASLSYSRVMNETLLEIKPQTTRIYKLSPMRKANNMELMPAIEDAETEHTAEGIAKTMENTYVFAQHST